MRVWTTPSLPLIVVTSLVSLALPSEGAGNTFHPIPVSNGTDSVRVNGISGDGVTVVGQVTDHPVPRQAFHRTGLGCCHPHQLLGDGSARATSEDGSTIVGYMPGPQGTVGMIWTSAAGMQPLGGLPGASAANDVAYDVSADGGIAAGTGCCSAGGRDKAFVWDAINGVQAIGDLGGGVELSRAFGVSADGSTVVGQSSAPAGNEAMKWDAVNGMVGLGDHAGGPHISQALDVSGDGSTIVGVGTSEDGEEAFIWDEQGGIRGLGTLASPVHTFSRAYAVSWDGILVAGNSSSLTEGFNAAFIWTEELGMRSLREILEIGGADVLGWKLQTVNAVSADGLTLIGSATDPNGDSRIWVAELVVPEPSSHTLLAVGLLFLALAFRLRSGVAARRLFFESA